VDHVKIVNSGLNSLVTFGRTTSPQFDPDELRAAVQAAHRRGLKVMVHANGNRAVSVAVEAGCDSIEHGFFMGMETLRKMADRGTVWIPTAVTMEAYAEYLEDSGVLPPCFGGGRGSGETQRDAARVARRNLEHQLEQMAAARRLGVTVALGTDAGSIGVEHGRGAAREFGLLMAAGFSPAQAVRCASSNGARLLSLERLGRFGPGRPATFIAVEGDPSGLPRSLARIRALVVDGRPWEEFDER